MIPYLFASLVLSHGKHQVSPKKHLPMQEHIHSNQGSSSKNQYRGHASRCRHRRGIQKKRSAPFVAVSNNARSCYVSYLRVSIVVTASSVLCILGLVLVPCILRRNCVHNKSYRLGRGCSHGNNLPTMCGFAAR